MVAGKRCPAPDYLRGPGGTQPASPELSPDPGRLPPYPGSFPATVGKWGRLLLSLPRMQWLPWSPHADRIMVLDRHVASGIGRKVYRRRVAESPGEMAGDLWQGAAGPGFTTGMRGPVIASGRPWPGPGREPDNLVTFFA
jgi:hypothetical protein